MVGGEHAFVHGTFASKLEGVGVNIGSHWDWTMRRPPQAIPKGCRGVVVLHDMVGHHLSNAAKDAASAAGIPFALVPRKFSAALPVLKKAGIVSDAVAVADEPMDATDADATDSELRSWVTLVLESAFASSDEEVAARVADVMPGGVSSIATTVAQVRSEMRASWSTAHRTADAERSFTAAVTAWANELRVDTDDPLSLSQVRAMIRTVFGVAVPDAVLTGIGFQLWEVRGAFSRERIRSGVAAGDQMYAGLSPEDRAGLAKWLEDGTQHDILTAAAKNMRGRPVEAVTILLRCVPDLSLTAANKAYIKLTGVNLGPFYYDAVKWMLGRTTAPVVDPGPVASTASDDLKGEVAEVARENAHERAILDAFEAAVEAVANGGTADVMLRMVNAVAAERVEKRELEAADAELRAAEELFKAAQEKARITRERIARMRAQ
ncbi:MAG: hypothetical protein EBT79_02475 [Actinobacteria bacterium]|nr:hypothetical protein [Actinomycetota bacterium]